MLSYSSVWHGLVNLAKLRADNNSLVAVSAAAALVQNVTVMLNPMYLARPGVNLYAPIAVTALTFCMLGRYFVLSKMVKGIGLVFKNRQKKVIDTVTNRETADDMLRGLPGCESPPVITAPVERLTDYLHEAVTDDISDSISGVLTPIVTASALVIMLVAFFLYGDAGYMTTALAATLCVCAPFSAMLISNLPQHRIANKLFRMRAFISGYEALSKLSETDAVSIDAGELFPRGAVILHRIKQFGTTRVDEAILDAASVIFQQGGTLYDMFSQTVSRESDNLREVDSIVYEDRMGISAWVNGRRVLIGNRELMRHHNVDAPSEKYERQFREDGKDLVYLSVSGTLAAMFVVSYNADQKVTKALKTLIKNNVSIIVKTVDANITPALLSKVFHISDERIKVLPSKLHHEYDLITEPRRTETASAGFIGGFVPYASIIVASKRVRKPILFATILQTAGIMLGYALVIFFVFMQGLDQIGPFTLLCYQAGFSLMAVLTVMFRRYV
jgi:cation transport ATPase